MSGGINEINTYYGRCRCCLSYGYLKSMWEEHYWEGVKEIYVQMLVQCFCLDLEHTDDSVQSDRICETCIRKLRDAHNFKLTVLKSQMYILKKIDDDPDIKTEKPGSSLEFKYEIESEELVDEDLDNADYLAVDEEDIDSDDVNEMEYEDVEYLEDEDDEPLTELQSPKVERRKKQPLPPSDRKWPKKLPKSERYKTYKQYSEEDFRACMAAVRNEEMTPKEAAKKYNIPKKTIAAKLRMEPKEQETSMTDEKQIRREKMFELIKELKLILTFTNATPYKTKANRYLCPYCATDSEFYEDPDVLRIHIRTQHVGDRVQKIDFIMRPHWLNETMKLDINNLICNVCCIPISNWNDMFRHLKEQHQVHLDQAYTRAIPYDLSNDLKCVLCKQEFTYYMLLDSHMNAHYSNYVCFDCGDTFLAENRLKQHVKTHDIGRFACSFCPKVFAMFKYKTKHEETVHKHLPRYRCQFCDARFTGEYLKHLHMLDKHKEKVKTIHCEYCSKTFTWRQYYLKHIKKKHNSDGKKFECKECNKKYYLPIQLREHMLRHTGEKHFTCPICNKKYVSSGSLKHHLNRHKKVWGDLHSITKVSDTEKVYEVAVIDNEDAPVFELEES